MPLGFETIPGEIALYTEPGDVLLHDCDLWHSAARATADDAARRHIRGGYYTGDKDGDGAREVFVKNAALATRAYQRGDSRGAALKIDLGCGAPSAQVQQQFGRLTTEHSAVDRAETTRLSVRSAYLQTVRPNLAGNTPAREANHSPGDSLQVRSARPRTEAVRSANIFVMNEVLQAVENRPYSRYTPRHQGGPTAKLIEQNRQALGLLRGNPPLAPALEMLAQHQVRGEVKRRPPLAQRRRSWAKRSEQLAQLAALTYVDQLNHSSNLQTDKAARAMPRRLTTSRHHR